MTGNGRRGYWVVIVKSRENANGREDVQTMLGYRGRQRHYLNNVTIAYSTSLIYIMYLLTEDLVKINDP